MNRFTANKYQCGEKYCRNLGKKISAETNLVAGSEIEVAI